MITQLLMLAALAGSGTRQVEATIYPTVRAPAATDVYSMQRIRRGRAAFVAVERFVDDPFDRIIGVRAVGRCFPTTTYGLESRVAHPVSRDDYEIMAYNAVSIWADNPWMPGQKMIVGGLGHGYGQSEKNLDPYDGVQDMDGPSGFQVEYGPIDDGVWPKALNDGTPVHWNMSNCAPFVSGSAGDWTLLEIRLDQFWAMEYSPAAWSGPHGYWWEVDHGFAELEFQFEAVHESGRVQR